jgi:hypothetical protein
MTENMLDGLKRTVVLQSVNFTIQLLLKLLMMCFCPKITMDFFPRGRSEGDGISHYTSTALLKVKSDSTICFLCPVSYVCLGL